MTEIKPGTPLPWTVDANAVHEAAHGGWCRVADCSRLEHYGPGRRWAGYETTAANAAYIVTACNAYPSLLNGLREAREALGPFEKADFSGSIWRDTDPASPGSRVIVGDFRRAAATLAHLDTLLAHCPQGKTGAAAPRTILVEREFQEGDKVHKASGYRWPGEVVAVFKTRAGKTRIVVECTVPEVAGALHIYSPEQLELEG